MFDEKCSRCDEPVKNLNACDGCAALAQWQRDNLAHLRRQIQQRHQHKARMETIAIGIDPLWRMRGPTLAEIEREETLNDPGEPDF